MAAVVVVADTEGAVAESSDSGATGGVEPSSLAPRLSAAREALELAEAGLAMAMRELKAAPRAEKTTIGPQLEGAFARMREAHREIAAVQALVSSPDDGTD